MDRLKGTLLFGCGLSVIVAVGGCRTPRSEVPPGRQYLNDGRQAPPVGFSADAHPPVVSGFPSGAPGGMAGPAGTYPAPPLNASASRLGAPTDSAYGPPQTGYTPPSSASGGGIPLPGSPASMGGPNPSAGSAGVSGMPGGQ
jgi:hypothetical protein